MIPRDQITGQICVRLLATLWLPRFGWTAASQANDATVFTSTCSFLAKSASVCLPMMALSWMRPSMNWRSWIRVCDSMKAISRPLVTSASSVTSTYWPRTWSNTASASFSTPVPLLALMGIAAG